MAEKTHQRRLRHIVSKEVALACQDVRRQREWRVDTGRQIARKDLRRLASPRKPDERLHLPELDMSPAGIERMRRTRQADSARRRTGRKTDTARRQEIAKWSESRKLEKAERVKLQATGPPAVGKKLSARQLKARGEKAVESYLAKKMELGERAGRLAVERCAHGGAGGSPLRARALTRITVHTLAIYNGVYAACNSLCRRTQSLTPVLVFMQGCGVGLHAPLGEDRDGLRIQRRPYYGRRCALGTRGARVVCIFVANVNKL